MMKLERAEQRSVLILSDLHGLEGATYIDVYVRKLQVHYDVEVIDTPRLGGVGTVGSDQPKIHADLLAGGAERAVDRLLSRGAVHGILAFSVGGWIAWMAMCRGLMVDQLVAVSATRLRYEKCWPTRGSVQLIYGSNDSYRPMEYWPEANNITIEVMEDKPHTLYQDSRLIDQIARALMKD